MKLSYIETLHLREGTVWNFRGTKFGSAYVWGWGNRVEMPEFFMKTGNKVTPECKHLTLTSHGKISRGQSVSLSASHLFVLSLFLDSDRPLNALWSTCTLFKQKWCQVLFCDYQIGAFLSLLHSVNWAVLEGSVIYSMESFCANNRRLREGDLAKSLKHLKCRIHVLENTRESVSSNVINRRQSPSSALHSQLSSELPSLIAFYMFAVSHSFLDSGSSHHMATSLSHFSAVLLNSKMRYRTDFFDFKIAFWVCDFFVNKKRSKALKSMKFQVFLPRQWKM